MLKEAIEKIEALARPQIEEISGETYIIDKDGAYTQVKPDIECPEILSLNSLEALVWLVKREALVMYDLKKAPLFITVTKHNSVDVFCAPDPDARCFRTFLYTVNASDIPGWEPKMALAFDEAAVALQTRFAPGGDLEYTLALLSQITTGAKVTYSDNGIATSIVTQRGVSLQQNQTIRPIVKLRPYRTFQEVEQPEGLFLIRINERGITFTEADGGMWKLTARKTVADYLSEELEEEINAGSVVVTI